MTNSSDTRPDLRGQIIQRLKTDLMGPLEKSEVITDRPSDRYITGILFPVETPMGGLEDENLGIEEGKKKERGTNDESTAISFSFRPSTAGISFFIKPSGNKKPALNITVGVGVYSPFWEDEEGKGVSNEKRTRKTESGGVPGIPQLSKTITQARA